jgi:hypothetical protein
MCQKTLFAPLSTGSKPLPLYTASFSLSEIDPDSLLLKELSHVGVKIIVMKFGVHAPAQEI